ncbi:Uncharacterized protein RNJ44_01323 [Nakaseomyces bracarensis]|uniref:Uncharacterized protein n=1 Tax=Nakaseomyces bracarensis TaxID=273131 RepID=A0ABR4NPE3_9SACH
MREVVAFPREETGFGTDVVTMRKSVEMALHSDQEPHVLLNLLFSYIDTLLSYDGPRNRIQCEVATAVLNIALCYKYLVLETMVYAYRKGEPKLWATVTNYLKRGVGILQFLKGCSWLNPTDNGYPMLDKLIYELGVLQQLSVILLSLGKIRSNLYNDVMLDLDHSADLTRTIFNSNNITLYTRLCISCQEIMLRLLTDKNNNSDIINKSNFDFLRSLTLLLVSIEQFEMDNIGKAIGLLNLSQEQLTKNIMTKSELRDTLNEHRIVERDQNLKGQMKSKLLNTFTKKKEKNVESDQSDLLKRLKNIRISKKSSSKKQARDCLLPILQEILNDLLLPLMVLFTYRYEKTNELYGLQVVETDEKDLIRELPKGIPMDMKSVTWKISEANKLVEDTSLSIGYDEYF